MGRSNDFSEVSIHESIEECIPKTHVPMARMSSFSLLQPPSASISSLFISSKGAWFSWGGQAA